MVAETLKTLKLRHARTVALSLGIVLMLLVNTATPHHSFAMFDQDRPVTLHGVVKEFRWNNPHVFIQLLANDEGGVAPGEWSIEMTSPEHMVRAGWKPGTLKSGDTITVVIHPVRAGSKGGQFVSAIAADGTPIGAPSSPKSPDAKGVRP
jgi:hypothetical protein